MSKITYTSLTMRSIAVFLQGKRVGTIHQNPIDSMWQYTPWGDMQEGGEKFPTLALCKKSLEED
jgi:hypothetical protein